MSVVFCRYLLQQRHLDDLAFLDAIDQLRTMTPTLPRLIFDHQLLDEKAMLEVFSHQAQHKISFEMSCKALGLWSDKIEVTLAKVLADGHQSIFHVLVERNMISPQDLIAAMDEFLAEQSQLIQAAAGEAA
jgi:hypothetical protein